MRPDPVAAALSGALDVANERHALLAANIANLDTPGYVRADLDFEAALADPSQAGNMVRRQGMPDLNRELGSMAETDTYYESCAKLLSMRYALMRESVKMS